MFCGSCGNKMEPNEKFCPACGAPLHGGQQDFSYPEGATRPATYEPDPKYPAPRSKKPILIAIIAVACVLAVVIVLLAVKGFGGGGSAAPSNASEGHTSESYSVSEYLDLGQKYLDEADFVNALVSFLDAIAIDDRNVEAYDGAADAYIGMGEFDSADEILTIGIEKTGDEGLVRKQEELYEGSMGRIEYEMIQELLIGTLLRNDSPGSAFQGPTPASYIMAEADPENTAHILSAASNHEVYYYAGEEVVTEDGYIMYLPNNLDSMARFVSGGAHGVDDVYNTEAFSYNRRDADTCYVSYYYTAPSVFMDLVESHTVDGITYLKTHYTFRSENDGTVYLENDWVFRLREDPENLYGYVLVGYSPADPEARDFATVIEGMGNDFAYYYFSNDSTRQSTSLYIKSDFSIEGDTYDYSRDGDGFGMCHITGRLSYPEEISDGIAYCEVTEFSEAPYEYASDNIYTCNAYGIGAGSQITIYLPGSKVSELPEDVQGMVYQGRKYTNGYYLVIDNPDGTRYLTWQTIDGEW